MFKARRLMPLALVRRAVVFLVAGVGAASVVAVIAAGVLAGAGVLAATAALGTPLTSASPTASAHPSATPTPTATPSPAPTKKSSVPPCATPSTVGAVKSKSTSGNTSAANGAAWTGVSERIFATLNSDGSVSGTPNQNTRISASGNSPVTVGVPVSGPISRRPRKGRGTPVVDGKAQVSLSPNGTAAQEIKSNFNRQLPVAVTVTYRLNGKTVSSSAINKTSGTVQVSYKLANVTSTAVSACFEGFNGKHQHQTVSAPVPIIADLSFTVPGKATSFQAPGASLSPDSKGVDVGWTAAMFEPVGALTKTFTFTMKTTSASIPTAHLLLATVNPFTLTGKVPATTAAVLGKAEAAVAKGLSSVQGALDTMQQRLSASQRSSSSRDPPADPPHGTVMDAEIAKVGNSIAAVNAELGKLGNSIAGLASDSTGIAKDSRHVTKLATTISAKAADIATLVNELAAELTTAMQHASQQVQQLNLLQSDLSVFPAAVKKLPAFQKLEADLTVAQAIAAKVNSAVGDAQQLTQDVGNGLQTLQSDISSLETKTTSLRAAATNLAQTAQEVLHTDFATVQKRVATLQDVFTGVAKDVKIRFARALAAAKGRIAAAVAAVKQALANAAREAGQALQASLNKAQAQAAKTEKKAQADLAKANRQYAQLLALDQKAVWFQLPGGPAADVTMQNGIYRYTIKG
jgi:hypothetical protein